MNISGTLTRDAKVSTTPNGKEVVNFSIAINDNYKDKEGHRVENTTFIDCAYWLTAKAAPWLVQGLFVELYGELSARAWINNSGEAKAGINFHVTAIKPIGKFAKKDPETVQGSKEQENNEPVPAGEEDALPF
ncbi:MAG: single-stranded DNA-binding protein [Sphingobacterium sp.]|jgi:single-strand DNA-binding protein|nr:single-stranded DNA-binding protein [Sphingobacterium sp.]